MTSMPSETITAAVGSIVGAVLILVDTFTGYEMPGAAAGALTLLISWLAFGITLLVRRARSSQQPGA